MESLVLLWSGLNPIAGNLENICSSQTPRWGIIRILRPRRNWDIAVTVTGEVSHCPVLWPSALRAGPWSNGPKARWADCAASAAAPPTRSDWGDSSTALESSAQVSALGRSVQNRWGPSGGSAVDLPRGSRIGFLRADRAAASSSKATLLFELVRTVGWPRNKVGCSRRWNKRPCWA